MQTIKKLYHNRIITIMIWLVVIFIAILKLPNITNMIINQGQPQFNASSQIVKANDMKLHWGRNISGTQEAQIVYNNPNGNITTGQQNTINKSVNILKSKMKTYGIKRITSIENNPNEKYQLKSDDGSTEIVKIDVEPQVISSSNLINNINGVVNNNTSSHLKTYLTNPTIISNEGYQRVTSITRNMAILLFILVIIIMGILFRSVIAPIIGFVTLLISYTVSLSIITNLGLRKHFPFNAYTPIMILFATIILGSIFLFLFYHEFNQEVFTKNKREKEDYSKQTVNRVKMPIISISLILAVAFGSSILAKFSSVRVLAALSIAFIVLAFAILTLLPVFTFLLDESIFWPNKHAFKATPHKLWNKLARFSLWQPIAGIVIVAYFIVPFTYSYHNNLDYTNTDYVNPNDQAVAGANVLKAHFSQGKPTPVTVYIKSNHKLDNNASLKRLDTLTTKLQSMKHVHAVYSVTQPSGMPINKYYVKDQLNTINDSIDQIEVTLHHANNAAKSGSHHLNLKQLNHQISYLNNIVSRSNDELSNNSSLQNQLQTIANNVSVPNASTSRRVAKQLAVYTQKLNQLSSDLNQTNTNLNRLNSNSQAINNYSQTVQTNLRTYRDQLSNVNHDLDKVKGDLKQANAKLNGTFNYLNGLKKASSDFYYITPSQIEDTDFQQNLYNYNNDNEKATKLEVVFQNAPGATTSSELKHLLSEVHTEIQGTNLKNAQVIITGEPVKQALVKNNYQHSMLRTGLLIIAIILIVMMLISRSILHPTYWIATFIISSLASLQLTHFTMQFIFNTIKINWYASLLIFFTLTIIATWELLPISTMFRKRNVSMLQWFEPSLTTLGQPIRYLMTIIMIIALGLLLIHNAAIIETGLTIIYTMIIFNIAIPIIISALGKLSYTIPNPDLRKPNRFFNRKK